MNLLGKKYLYPFTAVVGQDKVKKAIMLNLVNPAIGGVLISGEKGTAKSTLVRGLAALVSGMEIVEVPLNITEDRLVGTIDIERAIANGEKSFEPGLLAKAHGNILYVDEVNLLSDHVVSCLLDVCQSGVNKVEREGISYAHESRFVLIGTMNPEEGALRSQFLDRFGLYVETEGCSDISERKEIMKRRVEYEINPEKFVICYQEKTEKLRYKIARAAELLEAVEITDSVMKLAVNVARQKNCAGHRADITIVETARALAAWKGRRHVTIEDVIKAAKYALPHRTREVSATRQERTSYDVKNNQDDDKRENGKNEKGETLPGESSRRGSLNKENYSNQWHGDAGHSAAELNGDIQGKKEEISNAKGWKDAIQPKNDNIENNVQQPENIFKVVSIDIQPADRMVRKGTGKRSRTRTDARQGRYVSHKWPTGKLKDIAFGATLRAAAPYQSMRDKDGRAIVIERQDFREKVREKKVGNTILFVVDASGSMGAKNRMKATKSAILSLLNDAYQKRDMVGMIAFRGNDAELLLSITRSVDLAVKCLKDLPTGGRTPLSAGLMMGYEVLKARKIKDPEMIPLFILVSDGRANVSLNGSDPVEEVKKIAAKIAAEKVNALVIDTEDEFLSFGIVKEIADVMKARYFKIRDLKAGDIEGIVRKAIQ